jgi:hypothetical protein
MWSASSVEACKLGSHSSVTRLRHPACLAISAVILSARSSVETTSRSPLPGEISSERRIAMRPYPVNHQMQGHGDAVPQDQSVWDAARYAIRSSLHKIKGLPAVNEGGKQVARSCAMNYGMGPWNAVKFLYPGWVSQMRPHSQVSGFLL